MRRVEVISCFLIQAISLRNFMRQNVSACFTVFLLCLINLLNYMDRYTIASVLFDIEEYFHIHNSKAGLIQSVFILMYMLFAPLFGFLGDRYNRKAILSLGLLTWVGSTLAGSFVGAKFFWLFLLFRGMVGIGEASYSTIAPTIFADIFTPKNRIKALIFFYFATPVGSGIGYIIGSSVAEAMGSWKWALRVTPLLGLIAFLCLHAFLKIPSRGFSEGISSPPKPTSFKRDIVEILKIKSYMYTTIGFTCCAFVIGTLALWGPSFIKLAMESIGIEVTEKMIGVNFGLLTCLAGIIGVLIGSETARRLRPIVPFSDPLVCAFGLLLGAPILFFLLLFARIGYAFIWVVTLIAEILFCLNWAIVCDITLSVIVPTRRSLAQALQIMISHAFGDASSPYLIGVISDSFNQSWGVESISNDFFSLQYALFILPFVSALGGAVFLLCIKHINSDQLAVTSSIEKCLQIPNTDAINNSSDDSKSLINNPIV